jgi:hypothetical protein
MRTLFFCLLVCGLPGAVSAGPFSRRPVAKAVATVGFGTAQAVAEQMARIGRVAHFGGNAGYEGCGSGSSPAAAEHNCCFRNRWAPREVGYAQSANGTWYACCRY